jgi:hypothetical protein
MKNEMGGAYNTYGERRGAYRGGLKERDYLEDLRIYGWIIFKCIFKNLDCEAWTGLIWLRIGIGGGRL